MRTLIVASLLLVLSAMPLVAQVSEPAYSLNVFYDAESRTIDGSFDLQFVPESATVYFSLLANLDAHRNPYLSPRQQDAVYPFGFEPSRISVLSVDRVTDTGEEEVPFRLLAMPPAWQTYSLEDGALAVDLPAEDVGQIVTLRCRFLTEVPRTTMGDQAVTDGVLTWRFGWFPILFPEQSNLVEHDGVIGYAGRESFPLVFPWSQFEATITIPADERLLIGTDIVEEVPEDEGSDDDTPVHTYFVRNETPSRSLAFSAGAGYETYRLEGTPSIEVDYLSYHEDEARLVATWARDILADYIDRYGPYPRESLTIVENPTPHGQAFAADGIVWLSSRFFTHANVLFPGALNRITEYVLAHEIAHQWVGLGTGVDLDAEGWLSEGLAQYLSIRYFEGRYGAYGPNVFAPEMPGIVGQFVTQQWGFFNLREHFVELPYLLSLEAGFDEELIKPTENVRFGNAESVRLYDKGYMVARAIAAKIGTDAFERALTRAIAERRADILDARSFQALLEEESGQSLSDFFDFWVFGPGSADYSIRILQRSAEDGVYTTRVAVMRDGGVAQPVVVEATMQSGGTVEQEWDGVDTSAVLEFVTPTWVQSVAIDPHHEIPDRNRLNNNAPVKVVGAANSNVLPLDAYVLAPNQSTGALTLSYLDRLRVSVSQTNASATVRLGRDHRVTIHTSFATPQPTGTLAYTYTGYAQPETGSAAEYWEPAFTLTATGERVLADGEPLYALQLRATHLRSIASSGTQSVMIRIAPHGIGQIELSARDELRLVPGAYLSGSARIGISGGTVPQPLKFRVSELRSIALPRSDQIATAGITLELPSSGELPYSVFGLVMMDRVQSRLFLTAGTGWTTLDEFGTTSISVEAGMEQIIGLSTLGGLIPLTARLGVATPVVGTGNTVIYWGISF